MKNKNRIKKVKSKKRNRKQAQPAAHGPLARRGGGGTPCTFFSNSRLLDYYFKIMIFLFHEHLFDIPNFFYDMQKIF